MFFRNIQIFFVNNNGVLTNEAEALGIDLNSNVIIESYLNYDNDGDLDIIVNNYQDDATLLENETLAKNTGLK